MKEVWDEVKQEEEEREIEEKEEENGELREEEEEEEWWNVNGRGWSIRRGKVCHFFFFPFNTWAGKTNQRCARWYHAHSSRDLKLPLHLPLSHLSFYYPSLHLPLFSPPSFFPVLLSPSPEQRCVMIQHLHTKLKHFIISRVLIVCSLLLYWL